MSAIYEAAMDEWRRVRRAFDDHLQSQVEAAETHCNGVLLNARGRAAKVSSYSLFYGPMVRARAYASEELLAFWDEVSRRVTFAQFESQFYERYTEYDDAPIETAS